MGPLAHPCEAAALIGPRTGRFRGLRTSETFAASMPLTVYACMRRQAHGLATRRSSNRLVPSPPAAGRGAGAFVVEESESTCERRSCRSDFGSRKAEVRRSPAQEPGDGEEHEQPGENTRSAALHAAARVVPSTPPLSCTPPTCRFASATPSSSESTTRWHSRVRCLVSARFTGDPGLVEVRDAVA